jgi:hypothetical protein
LLEVETMTRLLGDFLDRVVYEYDIRLPETALLEPVVDFSI